ncbi:hypothetical protein ACFQY7_07715 [Actinomadura luteofluorescens]|uniref:hypothetical protein n=1 Tax=Actinomadura luteofluorescens TaxID=46163 RepID=UPI003629C671
MENPPQDSELVKPQAPATPDGQPLRPSYLTRWNYTEFVARYRVVNAPAPPPSTRTVTFSDKQDGTTTTNFGRSGKIEIPEGYAAKSVTVQATHLFEAGSVHNFHIVIGGQLYVYTDIFGAKSGTAAAEKELSISIAVTALCWSVGVDVECVVTPEAEARWQQSVYDAVIAAYQQQLAEYNERAAQRELQRSTNQQFGRNPLVNRRVERDELKKWVIMMLAKKPDLNLDSFQPPVPKTPPEPILDLDKANANGKFIRFLENAFEWQNMLYVCYPHMWGRGPGGSPRSTSPTRTPTSPPSCAPAPRASRSRSGPASRAPSPTSSTPATSGTATTCRGSTTTCTCRSSTRSPPTSASSTTASRTRRDPSPGRWSSPPTWCWSRTSRTCPRCGTR